MQPVVKTEIGVVQGRRERVNATGRAVNVFRGIPYAAPPVGPLRFRWPQPASAWTGTLDAGAFGPSPLQSQTSPFSGLIPGNGVRTVSEDCLTLNVWTPDGAQMLPVLVWLYGGAFVTGGTSIETYDAIALAANHDVVVASVNYRIGFLGFAWHDDAVAQPNCGLRDQIAALGWVRANISSFGGDPDNVTVFGESAGAGSLLHLATSPAARGLARRCILQSAGVDHTLRASDARAVTDAVLGELGLGESEFGRLWELPGEAIVEAQERAMPNLRGVISSMPFHPVVDGELVPETPSVAFQRGAAAEVELLVSWTADEMRLFPSLAADRVGTGGLVRWVHAYLQRRLGDDPGLERARQLVARYEASLNRDGQWGGSDLWAAMQTDGVMRLPARRIADFHAAAGGITYATQFSWAASPTESGWHRGAFHAIDLPFTFGTLDRCGWAEFLGAGPSAHRLESVHVAMWAEFARDGSVRVPGLGEVPAYDLDRRTTLVLDDTCWIAEDLLLEVADAWAGLWSPASQAPAFATS